MQNVVSIKVIKTNDDTYHVSLNDYYPVSFENMSIEEVASFINILAMVKKEDIDLDSIIEKFEEL